MASYNAQRQSALEGASDSTATMASSSSSSSTAVAKANDMLFRDANSFVYADHKPTEDQIDKVVQKLNMELVSLSLSFRLGSDATVYPTASTSATSFRARGKRKKAMLPISTTRTRYVASVHFQIAACLTWRFFVQHFNKKLERLVQAWQISMFIAEALLVS